MGAGNRPWEQAVPLPPLPHLSSFVLTILPPPLTSPAQKRLSRLLGEGPKLALEGLELADEHQRRYSASPETRADASEGFSMGSMHVGSI